MAEIRVIQIAILNYHEISLWAQPKECTILVDFSKTKLKVWRIDWITYLLVDFYNTLECILMLKQWIEVGTKQFEDEVFWRIEDNIFEKNLMFG